MDIRYSVMPTVQMEANDITFEDFEKRHSICDDVVLNGHGILRGNRFCDTVDLIKEFIQENPQEFVIIKMQQEAFKLNTLAKHILIRKLEESFGDRLVKQVDMDWWFSLDTVTLDLIWKHEKNILLLFRKEIYADLNRSEFMLSRSNPGKYKSLVGKKSESDLEVELKSFRKKLSEKGMHDKKYFLTDRWHDTDDPEQLIQSMEAFLKEKEDVTKQLKVLQVILTNQRNIWNHVKKFYQKGLISIEKLCDKLYHDETVSNFLIEAMHDGRLNLGERDESCRTESTCATTSTKCFFFGISSLCSSASGSRSRSTRRMSATTSGFSTASRTPAGCLSSKRSPRKRRRVKADPSCSVSGG